MEDAKYLDLIGRYLSGNISAEDRQDLLDWADASATNRSFFEEMIQLWRISATETPPFTTDIGAAWDKVDARISTIALKEEPESTNARLVAMNWPRLLLRVAAVLMLALGMWWWFSKNNTSDPASLLSVQTQQQQKQVELPDGSTVWLNSETSISYFEEKNKRKVQLSGEAFFEVTKDPNRPFVIQSGEVETRVLGTSFNLRAYPEEKTVEISVETGIVEFAPVEKMEKLELEAGSSGVYKKGTAQLEENKTENANANAWKTKELHFEDVPMEKVKQILERYFNKTIVINNQAILNCKIIGEFKNPELDTILNIMEYSMNLKAKKLGDTISLSGAGCDK